MSKGTVTIPLDEYEAMRDERNHLGLELYAEQNKNDEYEEVLYKLGIDKGICYAILNGAEVRSETNFDYPTLTNRHHILIVLEGEERKE